MKVAICGLLTTENLGEWFIAESLKYLIENEFYKKNRSFEDGTISKAEKIEFVYVDILANNDKVKSSDNVIKRRIDNCYKYKIIGIPAEILYVVIKKVTRKINSNILHKFRHFIWNHAYNFKPRFSLYYESRFKGVDFIIIDGAGLLEYSSNEYQEPLNLISKYGEKYKVPIIYNAIGRSGEFDPNDYRCKVLMEAINSSAVRYVSARDSVDEVQQCVGEKHNVKLLADAAFWSKDAYGVEKHSRNKTVGIGLIRGNCMLSYGVNFGEEKWINTFGSIAKELSKRGYDYFFFTNGLPADFKMGRELRNKLNLPECKFIQRPLTSKELINTISGFEGLITCRMHSSIVATSLGIPSVALSWNPKINKYFKSLGYPERAIEIENFDAKYVVDAYEKALKDGISEQAVEKMKLLALKSVQDYIDMFN